jgi:hypothetical protein
VCSAALGPFLAAVQNARQNFLETLGLQKPVLDVIGNERVELRRALPGFGRAGVIPITTALAGAQRHRHAACSTEANAGEQRRAARNTRCGHRRAAHLEQHLHGLELGRVDDCRRRHLDHLVRGLAGPRPNSRPVLGRHRMSTGAVVR